MIKNYNEYNINESNIELFQIDDIILYDDKYISKVIKIHDGYELLKIRIYHPSSMLNTTETDVSSTLCKKYND